MSPPTRGAWIETEIVRTYRPHDRRRPARGGRVLKHDAAPRVVIISWSPPTRGAWIETFHPSAWPGDARSPPTRGAWIETKLSARRGLAAIRRPPRGGRGLKHVMGLPARIDVSVAPHAGGVD